MDEIPSVNSYSHMTIQELCSALNQDDANELRTVMEAILMKLVPEVESKNEKKNLTYIFLHQMALPVYYLNQSWSQTYGEETNHIVTRAFAIFMSVIFEFKNKETKNRAQTKEEFLSSSKSIILDKLFESVLIHSYSLENDTSSPKTSSVINSLSFQLSPYVKMLPRFDAIPVIISCMRQDDLLVVKMAVETLTLLCQWNQSFVKTITEYMFSSTIFTLLTRLRFTLFNNVSVNHFTRKTKSSFLQRIRSSASRDYEELEEEKKRLVFLLDTDDSFFSTLPIESEAFRSLFVCSEENGQEELLHSVLLLILYMEGTKRVNSHPSELLTELHASECEFILMDFLYHYIQKKDEEMVDLILGVLLLLFQHFQNYSLFIDLSNSQKSLLLKCCKMSRRSIYEQVMTLILISILHTKDEQWFIQDEFTNSIFQRYPSVSTTTQILINLTLRQFMLLQDIGTGLVNYCCYMHDICSIFELDLPWTKPYLAFILFTRLWKGFQPRVQYWTHEGNQKEGVVDFLYEQLANTTKVKNRTKQLYSKKEGVMINSLFDEYMKNKHFTPQAPLSFYPCLNLQGSNYIVMGSVQRAYLCKSFQMDLLDEDNENGLIRNMKIKTDKEDSTGMSIKLKLKGKILPWEKGEMKSRYFVVTSRYLYEYFDDHKNAAVHKQIDLTNLNVDLCTIEDTAYIVLSYLKTPLLLFTPQTTFTTIDNYQIKNEHFPTQVYLWYYAMKTLTKLAFQPPTEEENSFLPLLPNTVWRHDYQIQDDQRVEKEFALKSFFGKVDTVDFIHHNMILPARLRDCTHADVVPMLLSLLQEHDWTVMLYAESMLRFIQNDADESSRSMLTNRGITYITENRRKITGIMKIQGYIECKQAKVLLKQCRDHLSEIMLLQKSIRAAVVRAMTKADVEQCNKESTIEPHADSVLSSRGKDACLEDERMFITQSHVNRCLDEDYSVHPTILNYFVQDNEKAFVKSIKKCSVEEIAKKIDREQLYAFYQCEDNKAFAIV